VKERPFSLGTIILAAGRSTRMGQAKLLLPWGRNSILGHLIALWSELGADEIAVVCVADSPAIGVELDRLGFSREYRIYNPQAERGMFSSIICAAQWSGWSAALSHWAVVLGDQPHIQRSTLGQLLKFAAEHADSVCQPARNGRRGHPVVLPRAVFLEIAGSKCTSLKEFLAGHKIAECACEDPGLNLDIDRPEDYQKALALAGLGVKTRKGS
jgi:molybdenum cofactor cytidylyltransferase